MNPNPYDPPQSDLRRSSEGSPHDASHRATAMNRLRISLLILLPPAIYNFYCFHFPGDSHRVTPLPAAIVHANRVGFLLVVAAVWYFGLVALEFITAGAHGVLARRSILGQ